MASHPSPSKKNKPSAGRDTKPVPTPVTDWLTTHTWLGETPPPAGPTHPPEQATDRIEVEAIDDALAVADGVSAGPVAEANSPPAERPAAPDSASDPENALGDLVHPGTGSGWLDSAARRAKQPAAAIPSGSTADIDLPPSRNAAEEPSDIFTAPRRGAQLGGSDVFGGGGVSGSDLFPAGILSDPGSNLFAEPSRVSTGGESDLFGGAPSAADRGSSVFDSPSLTTDRVDFESGPRPTDPSEVTGRVDIEDEDAAERTSASAIDLLDPDAGDLFGPLAATGDSSDGAGKSGGHRPDFEETDREQSGSNLFGDGTILDMDLQGDDVLGHSGVNLLNPDADAGASGPRSSIFSRTDQLSDGGRVDLEEIPLLGSSDEGTGSLLFGESTEHDAGPASGIFGKGSRSTMSLEDGGSGSVDFELPKPSPRDQASRIPYQDSGGLDWSAPLSVVLKGGTLDALPPSGVNATPTPAAQNPAARIETDGSTEADLEIDRLAAELSGRHARPVDDESVFSAGDIDPNEFGIPPEESGEPSDVFDSKLQGSGGKKRPSTASLNQPVVVPSEVRKSVRTAPATAPAGAAKSGGLGKILAGLAAGVAVGAGGAVGALSLLGGETSKSAAIQPVKSGDFAAATPTPSVRTPDAGLIAADPAAALAALENAGDSPATKAVRGQARWLSRVRAAAASGLKLNETDPELVAADEELKSVVASAADLKPDEALFAVKSALHRGLIQETLGKPDAALAVYAEARRALPAFSKVFDSAELRVKSMKKNADGSPRQYSLLPADASDLGGATALLELATVAELDDEPGFHFWKAVNHAANWGTKGEFDSAIKEIRSAKSAHEARRRKLAGLGLNPLSDPTEQMFLRACDELVFYWTFKKRMYDDAVWASVAGPDGKPLRGSTNAMIDELLKAKKAQLAGGSGDPAAMAAADARLKRLSDYLAAAKKATEAEIKKAAEADVLAKRQLTEAQTTLATAKEDAARKATEAAAAKDELAAAAAKVKLAEAALDPVIAKLKEAKLIDAKADRPAALAALPDAAKKATLVGGSGEVADLAKQLAAAREEARTVRDSLESKVAAATAAEAAAREAAKAADARVAAEVRKATSAAAEEAKRVSAAREAEKKSYEEKLAVQAEQFRLAVAAARTTSVVVFTDADRVASDRATRSYAAGLDAFFAGNAAAAEPSFAAATTSDPNDARYWYFLGMARWAAGNRSAAETDFRKGAELEARGLPGRRVIGADLEKVQGPIRVVVDAARP